VIADIAFTLHTPLDALMDMEWDEVQEWHRQCERLARLMAGKTG
jgi:hypothetical protein